MKISMQNIAKSFGDKEVLHNISMDVDSGEFVALLGPSGCGKTTLLNLLAGLIDLDGGSIQVGNDVWSKQGFTLPAEKRRVGMVFQDFALWPHMSVFDNVAFGLKLTKTSSQEVKSRVHSALSMVQMERYARAYPHQLSGGQKQRIAIARALAPNPTIMLMDEPLSSLDAKLREQMRWELLSLVRESGITTIYVTHDQVEALSMADHVVLLNDGMIEQSDKPTALYHYPKTTFAATFVGASNVIRGTVDSTNGKTVTMAHHHHYISCVGEALAGQSITMMIRPSDIKLMHVEDAELVNDASNDSTGTNQFEAAIEQRAFHGVHWQYRVKLAGWEHPLEVWATQEMPVGIQAMIELPLESCRIVDETREAINV